MKVSAISTVLLAAGASAAAIPEAASSALHARQQTGTQNVPGLGARKKEVMDAGADTFDLAIAMLETNGMDANVSACPPNTNPRGVRLLLTRHPTSVCLRRQQGR